jgi:hypothetical protein
MVPTIFLDLDGTVLRHKGNVIKQSIDNEPELLEGSLEKLNEWHTQGAWIVITTGRPISMKEKTIEDLRRLGVIYNDIIFNLPRGTRHLVNDTKSDGSITAFAHCVKRNEGVKDVKI